LCQDSHGPPSIPERLATVAAPVGLYPGASRGRAIGSSRAASHGGGRGGPGTVDAEGREPDNATMRRRAESWLWRLGCSSPVPARV
jgi:hypothetical protein